MISFTKSEAKKMVDSSIYEEKIFYSLFSELKQDKHFLYSIDDFFDNYMNDYELQCPHDDYEICTEYDPILDEDFDFAKCKKCGKTSWPDEEKCFSEWN
jgi:hypothetical protein